ncbi:MAG: PilN domain-containing protein [Elusimicrobiota bacterium]|nr:PilN domain-containing protein [Elusimicrobiota bacterium]
MTKINLIPKEAIVKEEHPELAFLALGAVAVIVVVLGYGWTSKLAKRAAIKKEITTVEKELAQLQTVIDQIARIKSQRDVVNAKKTALEGLIKTRLLYPMLMEDVAKILPSGMWLINLNTKNGDATTGLSFGAVAYDNYIIADLLQAFEDSKLFQKPEISGIASTVGEKGIQTKQFSITVDYVNQVWK